MLPRWLTMGAKAKLTALWCISMSHPHEMFPHTDAILIFHFVMFLCDCGRMTPKGHMLRHVALLGNGRNIRRWGCWGVSRRSCGTLASLFCFWSQRNAFLCYASSYEELSCHRLKSIGWSPKLSQNKFVFKTFNLIFEIYNYLVSSFPFLFPRPSIYPSFLFLIFIASFSLIVTTHIFLNTLL